MGVTVISNPAAAVVAASSGQPAVAVTPEVPLDFAALLGEQLATSNIPATNPPAKMWASAIKSEKEPEKSKESKETVTGAATQDFLPIAIYQPPPVENKSPAAAENPEISLTPSLAKTDSSPAADKKPVTATLVENVRTESLPKASTATLPNRQIETLPTNGLTAKPEAAANLAAEASTNNVQQPSFATVLNSQSISQPLAHTPKETQAPVNTPLQDKQWPQSFGERVVWMAKNEQQVAQISINPPQLGPIQITLNLNGDQASAIFTSPHAEVRQAIQDAMPQLREMLSSAGVSLGQTNVGAQTPQQNKENPGQFANGNRSSGETAILSSDSNSGSASSGMIIQRGRGLVDLFA